MLTFDINVGLFSAFVVQSFENIAKTHYKSCEFKHKMHQTPFDARISSAPPEELSAPDSLAGFREGLDPGTGQHENEEEERGLREGRDRRGKNTAYWLSPRFITVATIWCHRRIFL